MASNFIIVMSSLGSSVKKENDWIERPAEPILLETFNGDMEKAVTFYSSEVDRLYLANYLLNTQLKASLEEKKELGDRIFEMEKNQRNNSQEERKKRHRRCASEIAREFQCKAPKCGKSYGTEGSLSQHMKIKHPELVEDSNEPEVKKK